MGTSRISDMAACLGCPYANSHLLHMEIRLDISVGICMERYLLNPTPDLIIFPKLQSIGIHGR